MWKVWSRVGQQTSASMVTVSPCLRSQCLRRVSNITRTCLLRRPNIPTGTVRTLHTTPVALRKEGTRPRIIGRVGPPKNNADAPPSSRQEAARGK
jgi:hypothetical protein